MTYREAVMTILRRIPFMALAGATFLLPVEAAAQPIDPQAQLRETARAVEECAKRGCEGDEMQTKLAALKAAQTAFEASLGVGQEDPVVPEPENDDALVTEVPLPEPVVDPEPEPEAVEPWLPPPAYRPGGAPYPPADLSEGSVRLRREHLGRYWVGLGMVAGGSVGFLASVGYIGANAEDAAEFSDIGAGVVLATLNLVVLITGGVLFSDRGELVPDTTASVAPTRDGMVVRF
jgi:hypothetical protein